MGRRAAIFAAGLSVVFGAQLAIAAATEKIETALFDLEIQPLSADPPTARYTGQVKADKLRCERGREVIVIHDSDPPFTIGTDNTNSEGRFRVVGPLPPGGDRVIFNVILRDISTPRRDRICESARRVIKLRDNILEGV